MSDTVRLERRGTVATLIVDRPPLNVLDMETLRTMEQTLAALAEDRTLQVLVVTGSGDRAFSAGVAIEDHTPDRVAEMLDRFHGALRILLDFPTPTLAAVRGHCLGGGMELAAACDLRLAAESARFGQPEIALGCFPPFAAALFPTQLGRAAAFDLVLTGRILDAAEAQGLGFVHRTFPIGDFGPAVDELVTAITEKSAAVTRLAVRALRAREGRTLSDALEVAETIYREELTKTHDMREGLDAFLEKRSPRWTHS